MDHLWAPWRLSYITTAKDKPHSVECFICQAASASSAAEERERLVPYRSNLSVVVLNHFPYNNGHLLVCPRAHKGRLDELTIDELLDLQLVVRKMIGVLQARISPEGFNVGLNLGHAAGAGVPGHLHWHIVPRWNGDTNFMPVVSDTKVISQSLEALYDLVRESVQTESHE